MRGLQWTVVALVATLAASGCSAPSKRTLASTEPGLSTVPGDSGVVVADRGKPVPAGDTFVDRHPLFYKPRQYYESTGNNKVTKTAAAAVLGVPAGIYGELKQIVVGTPPTPPGSY
jgi:hypothetical protein